MCAGLVSGGPAEGRRARWVNLRSLRLPMAAARRLASDEGCVRPACGAGRGRVRLESERGRGAAGPRLAKDYEAAYTRARAALSTKLSAAAPAALLFQAVCQALTDQHADEDGARAPERHGPAYCIPAES